MVWVDAKLVTTFRAAHHRASLGDERVVELVFNATAGAANIHEVRGVSVAGLAARIVGYSVGLRRNSGQELVPVNWLATFTSAAPAVRLPRR